MLFPMSVDHPSQSIPRIISSSNSKSAAKTDTKQPVIISSIYFYLLILSLKSIFSLVSFFSTLYVLHFSILLLIFFLEFFYLYFSNGNLTKFLSPSTFTLHHNTKQNFICVSLMSRP